MSLVQNSRQEAPVIISERPSLKLPVIISVATLIISGISAAVLVGIFIPQAGITLGILEAKIVLGVTCSLEGVTLITFAATWSRYCCNLYKQTPTDLPEVDEENSITDGENSILPSESSSESGESDTEFIDETPTNEDAIQTHNDSEDEVPLINKKEEKRKAERQLAQAAFANKLQLSTNQKKTNQPINFFGEISLDESKAHFEGELRLNGFTFNVSFFTDVPETMKEVRAFNFNKLMQQVAFNNLLPPPLPEPLQEEYAFEDVRVEEVIEFEQLDQQLIHQLQNSASIFKYLIEFDQNLNDQDLINVEINNGKILLAKSQNAIATSAFKELLVATYGKQLVDVVFERYKVKIKNTPLLTFDLFKRLMVGIAANVTKTDLELLFNAIKQQDEKNLHCQLLITEKEKKELRAVSSFEDLSAKQIQMLETAFRTVPYSGKRMPIFHAFYEGKSKGLAVYKFSEFKHDLEFLSLLESPADFDNEDLTNAVAEHLGKSLCYLELKPGMFIPLLSSEGKLCYYTVASEFAVDGLIYNLLVPINKSQFDDEKLVPIHLNFRGTQVQPAQKDSGASVMRDLNPRGIGKTQIKAHREKIHTQLKDYLKKTPFNNIQLFINGHSLGGADVQRCTGELLRKMSSDNSVEFLKIKKIQSIAHNSPGIEESSNTKYMNAIKDLYENRKDLTIDFTYVIFDTDPVQDQGYIYFGAKIDLEKYTNFTIRAVIFSSEQFKSVSVHGALVFSNAKNKQIFSKQIIDKDTPNDLLQKILQKTCYFNVKDMTFREKTGAYIGWYGSRMVGRPLLLGAQSLVYLLGRAGLGASRAAVGNRKK